MDENQKRKLENEVLALIADDEPKPKEDLPLQNQFNVANFLGTGMIKIGDKGLSSKSVMPDQAKNLAVWLLACSYVTDEELRVMLEQARAQVMPHEKVMKPFVPIIRKRNQ